MTRGRRNGTKAVPMFEALEGRRLLSTGVTTLGPGIGSPALTAEVHPAVAAKPTRTTLTSSRHDLIFAQSVRLTATVRATSGTASLPSGTVLFGDGRKVIGTARLDSAGHAMLVESSLFLGSHTIRAYYLGGPAFKASHSGPVVVAVHEPAQKLSDGLRFATVRAGVGPEAEPGQYLKVNYTGYFLGGSIFYSSTSPGQTPFDFKLGVEQDIPGVGQGIVGWDEGINGIKVGERRVLVIPPWLAYGPVGNHHVPPNATLIFVVQLLAFDTPELVVTGSNNLPVRDNEPPETANGTDFGGVAVGSAGGHTTFIIANAGDAPLFFRADPPVVLGGADPGDFILSPPPYSNSNFQLTFMPRSKGWHTARITILTTDPRFPSFHFTVVGMGI